MTRAHRAKVGQRLVSLDGKRVVEVVAIHDWWDYYELRNVENGRRTFVGRDNLWKRYRHEERS